MFVALALIVGGVLPVVRAMRADAAPQPHTVAIAATSATEGNAGKKTLNFSVTLTPPAVTPVEVSFNTKDTPAATAPAFNHAATPGVDYESANGTITFAAGQSTKSVPVVLLGDAVKEPDELFRVGVAVVEGATSSTSEADGTIVNDDGSGPTLSINDVSRNEGATGGSTTPFNFTVTKSSTNGEPTAFTWIVTHDTTANTGTTTADLVAQGSVETMTATETTKTVTVNVLEDSTVERDETFFVDIRQASNAAIVDPRGVGTILNDDAPVISFDDTVVGEEMNTLQTRAGAEGETNLTFKVKLATASGRTVTAHYATEDDTAVAPGDYSATSGNLTFVPGDVEETFTVALHEDSVSEAAVERFKVRLSGVHHAVGCEQDCVAVGEIYDDEDSDPTISVTDVTVTETDSGTVDAVFTVRLSVASGQTVTADYATGDDTPVTATSPADYTPISDGTLTWAPGQTSKQVTVKVVGDNLAEGTEKFKLTVSNANGATCSDCTGIGTISDDDAPTLSVVDSVISEGNTPNSRVMGFSVQLSESIPQATKVRFSTTDGTASSDVMEDFTSRTSQEVTIPANQTTGVLEVPITSDTIGEPTEYFTVTVLSADNATIADGNATGEITDDDTGAPSLAIGDKTDTEAGDANGEFAFDVTLTGTPNPAATQVDYTTTQGTATSGTDFLAATGTVTIDPVSKKGTIKVRVQNDSVDEVNETFTVTISNPSNATITDDQGLGTITDNDGPSVTIDDVTVTEGTGGTKNAVFTVRLTEASPQAISVNHATANGTAVAPGDYTATSGTLTFPANSTASQNVTVPIVTDAVDEADETFKVTLSSPSNATIGKVDGEGTIEDDDGPAISVGDVTTATEGLSGTGVTATFPVTLSVASPLQAVTVDFTTVDGTAMAATDYVAQTGTVTFAATETAKNIDVAIKGDNLDEPNETFKVMLSNPQDATIADGEGVGTITDDDGPPTMSIGDVSVTESDGDLVEATFVVTLSNASGQTVTANYATRDGSATSADDYMTKTGTVTFSAETAQTTRRITVFVHGDTAVEGTENFFVDLTAPTNATITDATGEGTILDNDTTPPPPPAPEQPKQGYWMTASDGGMFSFGESKFYGSMGGKPLNRPVVGMSPTTTGKGYWQVASDGGMFSWGDATFFGSMGSTQLNQPIVAMASHPTQPGYWMVASDGGMFAFGASKFHGSTARITLNAPIVGMAPTASGNGYWLLAKDGGIFAFGDAKPLGSMGGRTLNSPIVGMAATPTGNGYWLVGSDGGIFAFGDAKSLGSMGGRTLNSPMVGMASTPTGNGYWLVGSDGGIFAFGDAKSLGSMGGTTLNRPVVGMARFPG